MFIDYFIVALYFLCDPLLQGILHSYDVELHHLMLIQKGSLRLLCLYGHLKLEVYHQISMPSAACMRCILNLKAILFMERRFQITLVVVASSLAMRLLKLYLLPITNGLMIG